MIIIIYNQAYYHSSTFSTSTAYCTAKEDLLRGPEFNLVEYFNWLCCSSAFQIKCEEPPIVHHAKKVKIINWTQVQAILAK